MDFNLWIRAVRAPFFTAVIVPVVIGTAIAFYDTGLFNLNYFLLTMAGMIFIHAGINLSNDYFDHKSGADEMNKTPTPFSGGSRVIQDGLIPADKILTVSLLSLIIGSVIGFYFYMILGNAILFFAAAGIFIGFFYTAPPFKLGYHGLGELMAGLGFGALVVTGAYYVQTAYIPSGIILASIPVAVLIAMVLFINEFPDYAADKKAKKKTLVVILGKRNAVKLYHFFLVFTYLWIIAMIFIKVFPLFTLLTFLTLPLAIKAIRISRKNYDKVPDILPANASTIMLHLFFGLLFALGYVLSVFI